MNNNELGINFENSIGPWMGRTMKIMECNLQKLLDEAGVDVNKEQFVVLKKLKLDNGITQNELAEKTYRNKSSMTRLLNKMMSKGYIAKKQLPTDKRKNGVFITQKGEEVLSATLPIIKKMMGLIEENITQNEKQQLINTLKKIQSNFGEEQKTLIS